MMNLKGREVITENQLYAYMDCPIRYSIEYQSSLPVSEPVTMSRLLTKVSNAFLLELMDGNVRSTSWIKKKWDILCRKYPLYLNDQRVVAGISQLINMFEYCKRHQIQIIDIGSPYELIFPSIIVQGKLGPVMTHNNKFELLVFDFNTKKIPDQSMLDLNLRYTMHYYAFRTLYQRELQGIRIVHVKTGNEFFSRRSNIDFNRMKIVTENIVSGIRQKIYYPRENILCDICTTKDLCRAWIA